MRKIIIFCFLTLSLFANFSVDKYDKQAKMLKSIDVDLKYLKDKSFIELFNDMSEREILYFTKILNEANMNIPIIKAILKKEGVPDLFLYLAMVESNFRTSAKSGVKAVGVWQFMAPTAKIFGLKIDNYVDERKDVVASTEAAAKYLKKLKDEFGKWYLAIFAYNCGDGCVRRAIRKAGTDELLTLINEDEKYLPGETRRFFRKILSSSLIAENDIAKYGDVYLLNQIMALNIGKVDIKAGANLSHIASKANVSLADFKRLNPQFKGSYAPPYKYHAYLPIEKISLFQDNSNQVKYAKNNVKNIKSYKVKKGDTLFAIAKNNNVTTTILKSFNNLKDDRIGINQTLLIPVLNLDENKEARK